MEVDNSLSNRILQNLEEIITQNQILTEFTIIPCEDNLLNRSPILFDGQNLALESWCIKTIYENVARQLFTERKTQRKPNQTNGKAMNRLLMGALLINPECTTFWNMKRELFSMNFLELSQELRFSRLVLSYKGKANEAFAYRRWLLSQKMQGALLEAELELCTATASKSPNNYHSYNHRIWTMEALATPKLHPELASNEAWLAYHVSEHSGFHYRQYLLGSAQKHGLNFDVQSQFIKQIQLTQPTLLVDHSLEYLLGKPRCLLDESSSHNLTFITLLLYDLTVLLPDLLYMYCEHETLWYHRRFLIHSLVKFAWWYQNITDLTSRKILRFEESKLYEFLQGYESDFISQYRHVQHAKRHQKWLKDFAHIIK